MKIEKGEVFSIRTVKGFGFIQYIDNTDSDIEFIRVLEPLKLINEITQNEIDTKERFHIEFPVKAALRRKIIDRVGKFEIPKAYEMPLKSRSKHNIKGEFLGWHIIDNKTLKRELKKELSENELKLSPYGIFNDTLLIEYLEKDWRLTNWK